MRRVAQVLIAGASVLLVTLASSSSVRAECPFFDIPPATDAAPSAEELFVGTVVENVQGDWFTFRLRIDAVLRGTANVGDVRTFDHLFPGWPFTGIPNDQGDPVPPCEPIPGWRGNVMAMALGALAPDGVTRYNAASWIAGRLPFNREVSRTTLAELRARAGLPPTDTASPSVPGAARGPDPLPVVAGIAAAVIVLVHRRRVPGR